MIKITLVKMYNPSPTISAKEMKTWNQFFLLEIGFGIQLVKVYVSFRICEEKVTL